MDDAIEKEILAYETKHYGKPGEMSAHSKALLRKMIIAREEFWQHESRDYVYGQDEGEPPKGAQW